MRRVTLAKSIRFPGGPLRLQGTTIEVEDALYDAYVGKGVFVSDVDSAPAPVSVPEPAPAVEEPAPVKAPKVVKPAKAASLARWREYAQSLGIDHKGLSKAEIIAATR